MAAPHHFLLRVNNRRVLLAYLLSALCLNLVPAQGNAATANPFPPPVQLNLGAIEKLKQKPVDLVAPVPPPAPEQPAPVQAAPVQPEPGTAPAPAPTAIMPDGTRLIWQEGPE